MKISGRELIGLTDSELLELMLAGTCPSDSDENLHYEQCVNLGTDADCVSCWRYNLQKIYDVE